MQIICFQLFDLCLKLLHQGNIKGIRIYIHVFIETCGSDNILMEKNHSHVVK